MLVSIIIPIYNVEKYITECLQSVMRQTYRNLEVLLVDDCGTDKSLLIIRTMLGDSEDATIDGVHYRILHHERNRGLSAARNTGIDAAKGEWLFFMDSDDWIEDDCIETLINAAKQDDGIETAIGQLETFDAAGHKNVSLENGEKCPNLQMPEGVYSKDIIQKYLAGGFYEMAWNKLVRRDFLMQHDLYFKEGLIHEDTLWSLCCVSQFSKVAVVHKMLYHYRIRESSIMSKSQGERKVKAKNTVLCSQIDYVITHGFGDNKLLFDYLYGKIKILFLSSLFRENREYALDLYTKLGAVHFWTYKQIWRMLPAKRDIVPPLSRLLPEGAGFRFCMWSLSYLWRKHLVE